MAGTRTIRCAGLALLAALSLALGGCGGEDDLPERSGDPEGTEIVPGEDGPVD